MAFLQLALPGILKMCGSNRPPLLTVAAELTEDVRSRHEAWTEFRDAVLVGNAKGHFRVSPCKKRGRLQAITAANSLICIPEGTHAIHAGDTIPVQLLAPFCG
jgi:molybdopterin molybdotransferase